MPAIVNPQIFNIPTVPGIGAQFGAGIGQGLSTVTDLLLKAYLEGNLVPKYAGGTSLSVAGPGQGFPSVPMVSSPQTARPMPSKWAGFQFQPGLNRQVQEAEIAYKKSQAQSLTPEFQADLLRRYAGFPPAGTLPTGNTPPQPKPSPNDFTSQLAQLYSTSQNDQDEAKRENAAKRIQLILDLMSQP